MDKNDDQNVVLDEQAIKELIAEAKVDLEAVESGISESAEHLEEALHDASKKLKKNLEELVSKVKKEVKLEALNFYHDNKKVINSDLKMLNSTVKEVLHVIEEKLDEKIDETDDQDERSILKEVHHKVVKLSRKYNHKYAILKIKLAVGNTGVEIKNLFN